MKSLSFNFSRIAAAVAVSLTFGLGVSSVAHAENHALIMWIGDYVSPGVPALQGIDTDARLAREIAAHLGVPERNIREVSNSALTHAVIGREFSNIANKINLGDNVFVYFSGHGHQIPNQNGSGCTEGIVPIDFSVKDPRYLFKDEEMKAVLEKLSSKAGQVVMLNDSCYSGGAATKDFSSSETLAPKTVESFDIDKGLAYKCGEAVNKGLRGHFSEAGQRGNNMLYVAASAANEVAFPTAKGSVATLAWAKCLNNPSTDTNSSGSVDGNELAVCANALIRSRSIRQTVSIEGNKGLPLKFSALSAAAAPVSVRNALEDVRAASSPSVKVSLTASTQRLRINQDRLDFTVTTGEAGYLYLLHVGSDGKTYDLLLPNKIDGENYLQPGTHRFPRASWQMQAAGPVGTSHIMAVLSQKPRDFSGFMRYKGAIADAPVNKAMARNIVVSSTGSDGGRYGASNVLSLQEY